MRKPNSLVLYIEKGDRSGWQTKDAVINLTLHFSNDICEKTSVKWPLPIHLTFSIMQSITMKGSHWPEWHSPVCGGNSWDAWQRGHPRPWIKLTGTALWGRVLVEVDAWARGRNDSNKWEMSVKCHQTRLKKGRGEAHWSSLYATKPQAGLEYFQGHKWTPQTGVLSRLPACFLTMVKSRAGVVLDYLTLLTCFIHTFVVMSWFFSS